MKRKCTFPPLLIALALLFATIPAYPQIVGIGIRKSDHKFFYWYDHGTVVLRPNFRLNDTPSSTTEFRLPAGKTASDIVGISFSSVDKVLCLVFRWYPKCRPKLR